MATDSSHLHNSGLVVGEQLGEVGLEPEVAGKDAGGQREQHDQEQHHTRVLDLDAREGERGSLGRRR